jgi:hypothetical protein
MNVKEGLRKAIDGDPTDLPAVAPAYLGLYLDEQIQGLHRAAHEGKLAAQTGGRASGAVAIDHAEDARFWAEAILGAIESPPGRPTAPRRSATGSTRCRPKRMPGPPAGRCGSPRVDGITWTGSPTRRRARMTRAGCGCPRPTVRGTGPL